MTDTFEHILIPFDNSESARVALRTAVNLSMKFEARLTLVYVNPHEDTEKKNKKVIEKVKERTGKEIRWNERRWKERPWIERRSKERPWIERTPTGGAPETRASQLRHDVGLVRRTAHRFHLLRRQVGHPRVPERAVDPLQHRAE